MAAGYDLKEARYDQTLLSPKEIKEIFSLFFEKSSKKESTYKFVMFKSIMDAMDTATSVTNKISFDTLFARFAEIYWILVHKYNLAQKAYSVRAPKTLAEKIIEEVGIKYKVPKSKKFYDLSEVIKIEIVQKMKKQCSKYVFGALYEETGRLLYSFSKEKEWIKINPLMFKYIKKHEKTLQIQNYQAWSNFYANIILPGEQDAAYYQRLLKREFSNNTVPLITAGNKKIKKENLEVIIEGPEYNLEIAKKARQVLKKYPDLGLYLAQVSDQIGEDKDAVREILDNSFWSKKDGSRYYYTEISDDDIITDAIFEENESNESEIEEILTDIDEENFKLLDNPELLIKQLKMKKKTSNNEKCSGKQRQNSGSDLNSKNQKRWVREEVVILVTEYFRTKKLDESQIIAAQQEVSDFLRRREEILTGCPVDEFFRNFAGIRLQSSRIRCLDPETKYHGMQGTKLQKEIVQEYLTDPKRIIEEAEYIFSKYNKVT